MMETECLRRRSVLSECSTFFGDNFVAANDETFAKLNHGDRKEIRLYGRVFPERSVLVVVEQWDLVQLWRHVRFRQQCHNYHRVPGRKLLERETRSPARVSLRVPSGRLTLKTEQRGRRPRQHA